MKKIYIAFLLTFGLSYVSYAQPEHSENYVISDFANLHLDPESFWNGADESGGFTSGLVRFYNDHTPAWGAWQGWSYSNITDNETPGWGNQYSAITGSALTGDGNKAFLAGKSHFHIGQSHFHIGKSHFHIGQSHSHAGQNAFTKGTNTGIYAVAYKPRSLSFIESEAHLVRGMYVTNATYPALSMKYGDDNSKKFGGADGNDPDWFKLSVWGMLDGQETDTIAFYLADYRFEDNANNYIVDTWTWLELSPLGKVDSLLFGLSSSDVGSWGMNTPAYFCVDNIYVEPNPYQPKYIAEVLDYRPAPGQFINKEPLGHPNSAASIIGGVSGALSLGAFGGSVVFRFEQLVINHPDNPYGIDFILFGNPFGGFSEPGIVSVMKDENGNGLPDDAWYELAGSDYFFSSTMHNNRVTYFNPGGDIAKDVFWEDDLGNTGYVLANTFHQQSYYPDQALFPYADPEKFTLSGTRIAGHLDFSDPVFVKSHARAFGYADNQLRGNAPWHIPANPYSREPSNAGGDGFDIGWAVDSAGNYVDLDTIHFVKVHTAVAGNAGWLGELSTEITGGVMVKPDPSKSGTLNMVVIKDLASVVRSNKVRLEALAFHKGRVQWDEQISWTTSLSGSHIDDEGYIHFTQNGDLTLTAYMTSNPAIYNSLTVRVELDHDPTNVVNAFVEQVAVYPNPAREAIRITGVMDAEVIIYNMQGARLKAIDRYTSGQHIELDGFKPGMYVMRISERQATKTLKLVVAE